MINELPHSDEPILGDFKISLSKIPQYLLLLLIRLYQKTISRALPANTCRFYPTCSNYGYQAVYKYGFFKGLAMTIWRILRCNPFNPGGYDPVP